MCVCQWRAGCQIKSKLWQKSKHSKIWKWTLGLRQSCFPPPSGCSPCVRETYDRSFVALRCCSCCLRRTFLKKQQRQKKTKKDRETENWMKRKKNYSNKKHAILRSLPCKQQLQAERQLCDRRQSASASNSPSTRLLDLKSAHTALTECKHTQWWKKLKTQRTPVVL